MMIYKNYLLLGSGISSLGAAKWIKKHNGLVTLSDSKPLSLDQKKEWMKLADSVVDEPQEQIPLDGFDAIVVSPGINIETNSVTSKAKIKNIPILSDIDLSLPSFSGKTIAVTGTNGKSTTVMIANHILQQVGLDSEAVGNIGISPCEVLLNSKAYDSLVVELSSYQLETVQTSRFTSSIFTSFSYDHIDRHGTLKRYLETKWHLASLTKDSGFRIISSSFAQSLKALEVGRIDDEKNILVGTEDELSSYKLESSNPAVLDYESRTMKLKSEVFRFDMSLNRFELHNRALAVLAVSSIYPDLPPEKLVRAASGFESLPHRQQKLNSVPFYKYDLIDDSKSTNVESTNAALSSINGPCYLLLGGVSKGESFVPLNSHKGKIIKSFCFGRDAKRISLEINEISSEVYETCEEAILAAGNNAKKHPATILFSPGCASFDEFKSFEYRGLFFQDKILSLLKG